MFAFFKRLLSPSKKKPRTQKPRRATITADSGISEHSESNPLAAVNAGAGTGVGAGAGRKAARRGSAGAVQVVKADGESGPVDRKAHLEWVEGDTKKEEAPAATAAKPAPVGKPTPPPPASSVKLGLRKHVHTKYCDRDNKVCTAEGRVREGEVLRAVVKGGIPPPGTPTRPTCSWQRRLAGAGADFEDCPAPEYHVPPMLEHQESHVSKDPSVLNSSAGAAVYVRNTIDQCATNDFIRILTKADAGYEMRAVVTYPGKEKSLISNEVGPVEEAPPHARELWISGTLETGNVVAARHYYFGGDEGGSLYTWIGIGEDGTRAILQEEAAADPTVALPEADEDITEEWASDPRCLKLPDHVAGWHIKVKAVPVRSDNVSGYPLTSKPMRVPGP